MNKLLAAAVLAILTGPVWPAAKTVTLPMPTMDCPVCPITVKKALTKVEGVSEADVNFEKRQAVVTFDDAITTVESLTQATLNAGYPSTPADDAR